MDKNRYIILIIAAGSSKRLGQPKQMVKWRGTTLLQHTIKEAEATENCDVLVVLGDSTVSIPISSSENVTYILNPDSKKGMGNSISFGIKTINVNQYAGVIISVCDQPFIAQENFHSLIKAHKAGLGSIVISHYQNDAKGPPTLFSKKYFAQLKQLSGDQGAKHIILNNEKEIWSVLFQKGEIDIDTPKDLSQLKI